MQYLGAFKTTDFKDLGINYLRGVLHTFASLNQPESTLAYDYEIIDIDVTNSDLIVSLKEQLPLLTNERFTLESITTEEFKISLENWLFETKLVSDYIIKREINFVFKLIKEITGFNSLYLLKGLDIAVAYEYFVLEADKKLYLIYFSYTD